MKKKYSYFKERGVNNPPVAPFFGNMLSMMLGQEHFSVLTARTYNAYPNDRFIGTYEFFTPSLFLRDPDLIGRICIKDFDYFSDHRVFVSNDDPIFSKSLIGLKGQKWKDMRSTLSPAFTGSKIKGMVPLIFECNNDLIKFLHEQIASTQDKFADLDTQDLLTRYTTDVIATCAFGLKTNSITQRENHFYTMTSEITAFSFKQMLKSLFLSIPYITKIIEINVFPKDAITFLRHTVLTAMKEREENNIVRPDLIQLLIEAKKGTLKHENNNDEKDAGFAAVDECLTEQSHIKEGWEDDYLVSQAFLFFFAGYETVSSSMKLLILELARNPDIQDRLRREIDEYHSKYGKIDYEKINQMKYLDMVVSENLRVWPPAINIERVCVKPYNIGKANDKSEKDFIVTKGTSVGVGVMALHHDPEFYSNPEKFDPERFSDENKKNIKPFTYLPFGLGPRNCIASRFALLELKIMTFDLIRHFEVSPAPQTLLPPRYDKKYFQSKLEGGHWLRFKCRN